MNVLVTGGAGFIGRWVVKSLLDKKADVFVFDNLSNGSQENVSEFSSNPNFKGLIDGDIRDRELLAELFSKNKFDLCIHLAAQINVQESIDNPEKSFEVNVIGTYNLLEEARKQNAKVAVIGTCMVYDLSEGDAINEKHNAKPLSPYAATKLAAEELAMSYYHTYGLPVAVLRPFNTYGPFQKTNMEGGVVSVFIGNKIAGKPLNVFGDGTQTRDLLYVEDCAGFLTEAAFSDKTNGEVMNAGLGKDIAIKDLALMIAGNNEMVRFVKHHHPQAEIKKLLCDYSKAKRILGWEPKVSLEEGIRRTEEWIRKLGAGTREEHAAQ